MQVHARSEDDIAAILLGLVADSLAHLSSQAGVPSRSQAGADGETCGIVGLAVALACRIDAHTSRPVSKHSGRNAQARDGSSDSRSTWHEFTLVSYHSPFAEEIVGSTHEQAGLFFQSHSLHHFINVVST